MSDNETSPPALGQQKTFENQAATVAEPSSLSDSDILAKPGDTAQETHIDVPLPTSLQKYLLLSAIRLIGRFRCRQGNVLMLTKELCVKYGSLVYLAEAQSMIFVARNTSVPVPAVHFAFTHNKCTYILMERICGQSVGINWIDRPRASRIRILGSLQGMVLEMRNLQPYINGNAICSVTGGSLRDPRLPTIIKRFGPFSSIQGFHNYLRNGKQETGDKGVTRLISLHSQHWDPPTFTHGDLSSFNILVRGDEIVSIIDWETAGWYPSYWEYTTANQLDPQNAFRKDDIDKFLKPLPDALEMEFLRQRYFGDY